MCGWVRVDNKDPNVPGLPIFRDADGGQDLYDAIDGTVVGVAYPYLGFFDLETVAAANFNPTALRVERYGCDPVHDRGCKR